MTLDSLKIAVMSLAAGLLAGCAAGYTTQSKTTADAQAAYGPHFSERRSVTRRTKQIV